MDWIRRRTFRSTTFLDTHRGTPEKTGMTLLIGVGRTTGVVWTTVKLGISTSCLIIRNTIRA